MSESSSVSSSWPSPVGLFLGLTAVLTTQVFVLCYHYLHVEYCRRNNIPRVQNEGLQYNFVHDMMGHLARPEGLFLLAVYLAVIFLSFMKLFSSFNSFLFLISFSLL